MVANNIWVGSGETRLAPSLVRLNKEINALSPQRATASDGSIGDADHQSRSSDHNPWVYIDGVYWVTAIDITDDDAPPGFDTNAFGEALRVAKHPAVKYFINDGRYWSVNTNYQWRAYNGPNGHFLHGHLSIQPTAAAIYYAGSWFPGAKPPIYETSGEKDMIILVKKKTSTGTLTRAIFAGQLIGFTDTTSLNNLVKGATDAKIPVLTWNVTAKQWTNIEKKFAVGA